MFHVYVYITRCLELVFTFSAPALVSAICSRIFGPFDVDLTSGRYVVDAKSIMGIFSLDLSSPIKVEIFSDECDELLKLITPIL